MYVYYTTFHTLQAQRSSSLSCCVDDEPLLDRDVCMVHDTLRMCIYVGQLYGLKKTLLVSSIHQYLIQQVWWIQMFVGSCIVFTILLMV